MKALTGTALAALALTLAACGSDDAASNNQTALAQNVPLKTIPAPNGGDWTQIVSETPQGGFRMGNPDAPVKLLEFGSLTCPHCAEFAEQGTPVIVSKYVASGQVSYEFRNVIRDPVDLAAALLARCNGPAAFFPLSDQLFATQGDWFAKAAALTPEQQQQIGAMPSPQAGFAKAAGLDQFARLRGIPAAKAQACLTDQAQVQRFIQQNEADAKQYDVQGTPTFVINGEKVEAGAWAALEPQLRAAIK
ncbi:thioredoxin domain-containing protein [Sphingosinicella sp. BN140058]|uniref:thioredoxin domain-containing protein n=1 Tax=Sphingosinicella sp. BN140058 TaxID=1892855 RepID=UPI0010106B38|nr:thioredoxin domain-containing protein [Sphingosinicella sp. BN140058]QAY76236.1 DsbA family protein [Sphingosinicella sp. BN140058]